MARIEAIKLRKRGNEEYKRAFDFTNQDMSLAPSLRVIAAKNALKYFNLAEGAASSGKHRIEWLSAKKSIGVANASLAGSLHFQQTESIEIVIYHFKQSVSAFSDCLIDPLLNHEMTTYDSMVDFTGETGTELWKSKIAQKLSATIMDVEKFIVDKVDNADSTQQSMRLSLYQSLIGATGHQNHPLLVALVQKLLASEFNKQAVHADERKCWQSLLQHTQNVTQALRWIEDCIGRITSNSMKYPKSIYGEHVAKLTILSGELKDSLAALQSRGEGAKYIALAQAQESILLNELDEWNQDLLWEIIDLYRQAILGAIKQYPESPSHEHEAIATAYLGRLFDNVLKNYEKGRALYFHVIQLADSLTTSTGQTFFGTEWYQIAQKGILADNKRREAFDQKLVNEKRAPTLEKLKPALDAIQAVVNKYKDRSYQAFYLMTHLYATHPSKSGKAPSIATLDKDNSNDVMKALRKCVSEYHVDRQFNKAAGIEWIVLCEEITKELNNIYGRFK